MERSLVSFLNRKIFLIYFFVFINLSFISSSCSNNQIDINSASLKELDELVGIGPVKAQAIIDARPFESVDDLDDVVGIGPATLEKIKSQGLACVRDEEDKEALDETDKEKDAEENKDNIEKEVVIKNPPEKEVIKEDNNVQEVEVIKLSAPLEKDIKSENEIEEQRNKYAIYGLIGFCILLGFLFLLKKRKYKNEFE